MKIERGIPIPAKETRKPSRLYPFKEMNVGDSFLLSGVDRKWAKHIHTYAERYKVKITVRRVTETSWRVWRIA